MSENFDNLATHIQKSIDSICRANGVEPVLFQLVILTDERKTLNMGNTAGNEGVAIKMLADTIGNLGAKLAQDSADRAQILGSIRGVN